MAIRYLKKLTVYTSILFLWLLLCQYVSIHIYLALSFTILLFLGFARFLVKGILSKISLLISYRVNFPTDSVCMTESITVV